MIRARPDYAMAQMYLGMTLLRRDARQQAEVYRKQYLDELKREAEREERGGNLQRVAEIRYGELPALEKELAERDDVTRTSMVKEEVDEDDIAQVVARWTGYSYPAIVITLLVVLVLFTSAVRSKRIVSRMAGWLVLLWNGLFVLFLVLTIWPHQVPLPAAPQLYPIDPPAVSPLAEVFLFLMLVFAPVLFVDFMLFARQISLERPSLRQMGLGFSIASVFVLFMVFFQVFTTIYDYAPIVGPLFRDRMWLVYLLVGLGLFLPLLLLRKDFFELLAHARHLRFDVKVKTRDLGFFLAIYGAAVLADEWNKGARGAVFID